MHPDLLDAVAGGFGKYLQETAQALYADLQLRRDQDGWMPDETDRMDAMAVENMYLIAQDLLD